jgi:hypothetical protein
MKIIKKSMRLWITFASVFSFLFGWMLFSHANKPAPLITSQPAVSSPAANQSQQLENNNSSMGGFQFFQQGQTNFSRPRLRTGGS